MPATPWSPGPRGGLLLAVRLQPGASRRELCGIERDAEGVVRLRARVSEPPENGRANAALAVLVARTLGLPKSAVAVVAGQTSRNKTLRIEGDPAALAATLAERFGPGASPEPSPGASAGA